MDTLNASYKLTYTIINELHQKNKPEITFKTYHNKQEWRKYMYVTVWYTCMSKQGCLSLKLNMVI